MKNIADQITRATRAVGKTYAFDEEHNANLPAQMWFQESNEGLILFVVFYTQACRWSKCLGCNLPSKSSQQHVSYKKLIAQIDHVFADPRIIEKSKEITKFIVSNNGSILDQKTFSSTALMYLMVKVNLNLPNLSVLCLETRPEYVEVEELEFLKRTLREGDTPTELELAIGFEAFDDHIRNDIFQKGLSLEKFESFVAIVAPFKYKLKCYLMQKAVPGMSDEEAVLDIHRAVDYLGEISQKYDIEINMHLNPTFAAKGTRLAECFLAGRYIPPKLLDVARAAAHADKKGISIFIGLYDEGLAVEGGSFIRKGDEDLVQKLEEFNRIQDFGILRQLCQA